MKTIKLNENQLSLFRRIVEAESAPDFEDGDIKEYGDSSENSTTATIHDQNGNPKYGNPIGDKTKMYPQSGWGSEALAGSNRIRY